MKKKIIGAVIATLIIATSITFAPMTASAGDYSDPEGFSTTVPAYQGLAYLPTAHKKFNGGHTVVDYSINAMLTGSYAIDGYLVDDYDNQKGDYQTGLGPTRNVFKNWSSAAGGDGCYYNFRLINHNSVTRSVYISGSWAPDDKNDRG